MVLKDIMAISGQPGLYRFIAQGKNAIIVEHLETKMRSSAFNSARVSSLEEISVFTEEEDLPLGKVLDRIHEKENGGPTLDYKADPEKLKSWFEEILPNYNREKVYVSDIRKIAQWYNILHKLNLFVKEEPDKKDAPEGEVKAEVEGEVEVEVKGEAKVKAESEAEVTSENQENKKEENTGEKNPEEQKSPAKKQKPLVSNKEAKAKTKSLSISGKKQSKPGNK